MKNKKIITTILLVAGLILLSGCVDNKTDPPTITTPNPVITVSTRSANPLISANEDWCTVGNKKTVAGKEFAIVGTVTDNGTELCKAELEITNEKTTYYFSEDGNITRMNSSSLLINGNASATVSASPNTDTNTTDTNTNSDTNSGANWSIRK
jgi:hypothetical protein